MDNQTSEKSKYLILYTHIHHDDTKETNCLFMDVDTNNEWPEDSQVWDAIAKRLGSPIPHETYINLIALVGYIDNVEQMVVKL